MKVVFAFVDAAGEGHLRGPFELSSHPEEIHLAVLEQLARPKHHTWSFALAFQLVDPPQIVADPASRNARPPTTQQIEALRERLIAEELRRLRSNGGA